MIHEGVPRLLSLKQCSIVPLFYGSLRVRQPAALAGVVLALDMCSSLDCMEPCLNKQPGAPSFVELPLSFVEGRQAFQVGGCASPKL